MTFKNPGYPFWGEDIRPSYCGLEEFHLTCEDNYLVIDIGSNSKYHVVDINLSGVLTLDRYDDPLGNICASQEASSTVLNETLYSFGDQAIRSSIEPRLLVLSGLGLLGIRPTLRCNTTTIRCGDRTFNNPLYPFWGKSFRPAYCGLDGFELHCENNDLVVDIGSLSKFHVVEFNSAKGVLTLNRSDDPLGSICASGEVTSTVLNATLYDYTEYTEDLNLFYNCDAEIESVWLDYTFTCKGDSKKRVYFFLGNSFELVDQDKIESCSNTTIQVDKRVFDNLKNNRIEPETLFNRSFEVHYNRMNERACLDCKQTEGLCWRGTNTTDNTCLYSNGTALPPYAYRRPGPLFPLPYEYLSAFYFVSPQMDLRITSWCKTFFMYLFIVNYISTLCSANAFA
uniref:non-specific serine/threonine protein kinase n=1 Tax=Daucus carota subsp. sativus TaxID=79200 RepID=A0A162A9J5_DAUCS